MLERLASACFRHRWRVIGLWLVALVGIIALSGSLAGEFADGSRLPGTDSQRAYDLLGEEMPDLSGDSATLVFYDEGGLARPEAQAAIRSYLDEVGALPLVATLGSPLDEPSQVSADGTVAFATVELSGEGPGDVTTTAQAMRDGAAALDRAGVEGLASTARVITAAAAIMVCVFGSFVVADLRPIKLIGLGLAVAVLIDATLVRMVLVPATMELPGRTNWWLPRGLDRAVPRLMVEARPLAVGAAVAFPGARGPLGSPLPPPVAPAQLSGDGVDRDAVGIGR